MEIYTNGVLEATVGNLIAPVSQAGTISATIGHSPFDNPGINGSVDEFRIYRGRLAPDEILASNLLGPNALLSTSASVIASRSGGNVVLSWPVAAAGFSVQARASLTSGSWTTLTNVPSLVGSTWQVSLPTTSPASFTGSGAKVKIACAPRPGPNPAAGRKNRRPKLETRPRRLGPQYLRSGLPIHRSFGFRPSIVESGGCRESGVW